MIGLLGVTNWFLKIIWLKFVTVFTQFCIKISICSYLHIKLLRTAKYAYESFRSVVEAHSIVIINKMSLVKSDPPKSNFILKLLLFRVPFYVISYGRGQCGQTKISMTKERKRGTVCKNTKNLNTFVKYKPNLSNYVYIK